MFETTVSTYQQEIDVRQHPSMEEAAEWASFTYSDGTDGQDNPVAIEGYSDDPTDNRLWVFSHGKFIPNI